MPQSRPSRRRRLGRARFNVLDHLEARQLFAARIVGDPTVYATIQAAVNAAAANAVVNVDAGTYSEQVTITKKLTLRGAQAGIDARSNARQHGAAETIVNGRTLSDGSRSSAFNVNANGVTIDGFTVQGNTSGSLATGAGIVIAPSKSGTKIFNNVVQNNVSGLFLSNNSSTDPAIIQHNVFRNNNNNGDNGGRGIYTDGDISGGTLTNVTIDGNAFFNNRGGVGTTSLEAAISFEGSGSGTQSNIRITNNSFDGNGKATLFFNTTGVLIENNAVTNTLDKYSGTLRFEGNNHNVTIRGNLLYDNTGPAVAVDAKGVPGDSDGFVIVNNNIYGNSTGWSGSHLGVVFNDNDYNGSPDVRNNYWGSPTGPGGDGPGSGDWVYGKGHVVSGSQWAVSKGGGELFSPWLTVPAGTPRLAYWGLPSQAISRIEAEDFDHGGQGNAYNDTTAGNSGGKYRSGESVDIEATTDADGGFDVSSTAVGEWLNYGVGVDATGTYTIGLRVANGSPTSTSLHVEIDGVNVTGPISVAPTGGWQKFATASSAVVNVTAGTHDVRVVFDTASGGRSASFNWMQFTLTSSAPVPATPTNLVAVANSATSVSISWTDNANNETGFIIERMTGTAGAWQLLTTAGADATSYVDTSVAGATTYSYRVRATNAAGDSANSNTATITTPALQSLTYLSDLPFATMPVNGWGPTELDESNGSSGAGDGRTITLNGVTYAKGLGVHASSDISYQLSGAYQTFLTDIGVDDEVNGPSTVIFQVWADGVKIFESGVMTPTSATQSLSLNVAGVQQLRLVVTDAGDGIDYDHADWAGARLTTTPQQTNIAAPSNLVASATSSTQVKLTWTDNAVGETGFKIERATDGVTFTQIGTAAADATTYSDSAAVAGGTYTYRVRATGGGTDSDPSNTATVTTPATPAVTYLSDMTWTSMTNGWGPAERDHSVGTQAAGDGGTLTLNGVTYAKGIGTNSPSEIVVQLNGAYGQFISDVGVDDKQTTNGSVTFQVWGDGVLLFDSGVMRATTATKTATLNVTNVQTLRLVVTDGGDGNAYDWADWAGARLMPPSSPPPATILAAGPSILSTDSTTTTASTGVLN